MNYNRLLAQGANLWDRRGYLIDGRGLVCPLCMDKHLGVFGRPFVQPSASIRADGDRQRQFLSQAGTSRRIPPDKCSELPEGIPVEAVNDSEAKAAIMRINEQILPEIRLAAAVRERLPRAPQLFE